jgi:hypothetical protein
MVQPDFAAGRRGVNKATTADINAGMGCDVVLGEQHQITRAKVVTGHRVTPIAQLGHSARWRHANAGFVNVGNQAAAVKATVGRIAAIAVRGSDQTQGINADVVGLLQPLLIGM